MLNLLLITLAWASGYKDFSPIQPGPSIAIELRYATANNFLHENLYGAFQTAYLHPIAHAKLMKAAESLTQLHPGWKLLIFDALRPRSIQKKLYARVKGTSQQRYVGNPDKGSIHNFGFAVDLSLLDANGKEVDMGTPFDDFSEKSQPQLEDKFSKAGALSKDQLGNRRILRDLMTRAGFTQLPIEWWHYDALSSSEVRAKFKIVE